MKKLLWIVFILLFIGGGFLLLAQNPQFVIIQSIQKMLNTKKYTRIDLTDCIHYFDGCNTCNPSKVEKSGQCTPGYGSLYCEHPVQPKCMKYIQTGIDLSNCISYFDGCNNCSVKDGKADACTLMYCETPSEPKCTEYTTGSEATGEVMPENIISPGEPSGPLAKMTSGKNILKNLGKTIQAGLYTITIVEGSTKDQLKITNNDNGGQVKYVDLPYDKTCEGGDTGPCGKFYNFEYSDDTYVMFSYVTYNENTILAALDLGSLIISEVFQISDETICDTLHNGQQFFRGNSQSFDPVFRITYKNDIGRSKDIGTFKVFGYYADDAYLYLHTDDGEYESNKRFLRKIDLNTLEEVETTSL